MEKEIKNDDLWCNYSNLPSLLSYIDRSDCDSVEDHDGVTPQLK
jgi:hypothetical protein